MSDLQFFRIKCAKFDFSWGSAPDLAKQGVGGLGNATKLLQRQRRDSQCNGVCRILSTGKPSVPFSRSPQTNKGGDKFSNLLSRNRRRKNYDASTNQSNNFGVSRKRFKPSTPWSTNQDQNDQRVERLTLHISSNTRHQRKCFVFVLFV